MIYFFPYIIMFLGAAGLYLGGIFIWLGFFFLFILFPLIEVLTQAKKFNSIKHKSSFAEYSLYFTPLALTCILLAAFSQTFKTDRVFDLVGIVLSTGALLGGFGITSAHELVHRREKILRAMGVYNLMLVNFAHWGLEHVYGHHKHVATPIDPGTAKKGDWVYVHWITSYFGVLKNAYNISKIKVALYWLTSFFISVIIFYYSPKLVLVWWSVSFVAVFLLETVDYIEHYGLMRQKNTDGGYLALKPHHSWDTSSYITNIALFNLGFHAHHHLKAVVPFEDLTEQPTAKQMPYGYSVMVLLALVPPVFIKMMDREV